MQEIKKVLICGLGGVGCVCATNIHKSKNHTLKVLLDEKRLKNYQNTPTTFNSETFFFEYITPDDISYKADLIIIATKDDGLKEAIRNIENFVHEKTIIISVLNGIHSEKLLAEKYSWNNILISFFIGHSCIRTGRNIVQDGNYEFIIGDKDNNFSSNLQVLSNFFNEVHIKHKLSKHIMERYWKKFMVNIGINQLCAANNMTFKEVKNNPILKEQMKSLIWEVRLIAEKEGINNPQKLYDDTINFLLNEFEDATPSMLQDIRAKRKSELEIFAGEVIRLGEKHKIETPENKKIFDVIKSIEKKNEAKVLGNI